MKKKYYSFFLFLVLLCYTVNGQIPILEFNFTRTRADVFTEFSGLTFPTKGEFSWIEKGATVIDIKKLVTLPEENFTYSSNKPEGVVISIDQKKALVNIMPQKGWFGDVPVVIFISGVTPYTVEKIKEFGRKERLLEEIDLESLDKFLFDDFLSSLFSNKVKTLVEERENIFYPVDIVAELKEDTMDINVGDDIDIKAGFYPGEKIKKPKISIVIYSALVKSPTVNHCDDGIQNYDETGVDCGGSCLPCKRGINIGLILLFTFWLALLIVVYLNIDKLKKFFKVHKKKEVKKIIKTDFLPIFLDLKRKVTDENVDKTFERLSDLFRDFFAQTLNIKYEITYDELKREIKKRKIKEPLEKKLLMLIQLMSDIDYSGYKIKKKDFNKLINSAVILVKGFK